MQTIVCLYGVDERADLASDVFADCESLGKPGIVDVGHSYLIEALKSETARPIGHACGCDGCQWIAEQTACRASKVNLKRGI
jgi:hypothetical protein